MLGGAAHDEAAKWTAVTAEVLAATAQQPRVAAQVAALQQRQDTQVVALLAEHFERLGLDPALPVDQIIVVIGALGIGLALRQAVLREPGSDVLAQVLGTMLRST